MYRSDLKPRDRSGAIAAVIAIHAALLFAFLNISGKLDIVDTQAALRVFDIKEPPPPPPPPLQPQQRAKPKEKEGGSSPKNIKSEATPVAAPKPPIVIPQPPRIVTSPTPRQGTAPTQGASNVPGPGTGAGGTGTGTGSGAGGSGPGGGGEGGYVTPPQLLTPTLRGRDFPRELLDMWPRGMQVFLRLRIDARGTVSECIVDRGTGAPAIDSSVCGLVHERFRYRPALNRYGQAVAGWAGYRQVPPK